MDKVIEVQCITFSAGTLTLLYIRTQVSQCCGALLAEALLKVRDCALQVNSEGWCAVNNTLSVLLTCSKSAKHVALQGK